MYAKNKKSTKLIALLLILALLIGGAVGGTLAWLLTETDPIINTFAAGNISISLSEPDFKVNTTDGRYKALPGDVITKDPQVTVEAGSESCYIRVFVINWWGTEADKHYGGSESEGWYNFKDFVGSADNKWSVGVKYVDETANQVRGHLTEFRYNGVVDASETIAGPFSTITVPTWVTGEQYASLDNFKVVLIAQAVQSAGSENVDEAFEKAGLPTVNLQLGEGAPATIADLIALHTPAQEPENGT